MLKDPRLDGLDDLSHLVLQKDQAKQNMKYFYTDVSKK